jgi:hypothetical protein
MDPCSAGLVQLLWFPLVFLRHAVFFRLIETRLSSLGHGKNHARLR